MHVCLCRASSLVMWRRKDCKKWQRNSSMWCNSCFSFFLVSQHECLLNVFWLFSMQFFFFFTLIFLYTATTRYSGRWLCYFLYFFLLKIYSLLLLTAFFLSLLTITQNVHIMNLWQNRMGMWILRRRNKFLHIYWPLWPTLSCLFIIIHIHFSFHSSKKKIFFKYIYTRANLFLWLEFYNSQVNIFFFFLNVHLWTVKHIEFSNFIEYIMWCAFVLTFGVKNSKSLRAHDFQLKFQ